MNSEINSKITDIDIDNNRRHAVVIGGSMAGLLSAGILSDHFDRVTVIERDKYPQGPESRPGVPQARHLHVLLPKGRMILEDLFPGFGDEMIQAGALTLDIGRDIAWLTPAGWGVNFEMGIELLTFSRNLLDWVVRKMAFQISNLRVVEECEVTGLLIDKTNQRVTGVSTRYRNSSDRAAEEDMINANLVVDAGGRASKLPSWLEATGYEAPEETVIDGHLGYSSRIFEFPEGREPQWGALFIQAAPPDHNRGGIMFPIEDNRWLATLAGGDFDYPPTDEEGFLEFARSLRSPELYDAIRNARPVTDISGYRNTENRRRHYEKLKHRPEGLLITGDSACAFNPVYGQGITTGALGATLMDKCLREQMKLYPNGELTGLAAKFQQKLVRSNLPPWMLATSEDYRYSRTEGGSPTIMDRIMHKYIDRVLELVTYDVQVRRVFLLIQGMIKPTPVIFQPKVLFKVLGRVFAGMITRSGSKTGSIAGSWAGKSNPKGWADGSQGLSAAKPLE